MGDCDDALREIYTYLDGEVDPRLKSTIRHHLEGCHDCGEVFDFQAELRAVVSRKCRDAVPEDLRRRVLDCLGNEGSIA